MYMCNHDNNNDNNHISVYGTVSVTVSVSHYCTYAWEMLLAA